jgi:predicted O-methyltransferase YrrM
MLATKSTQAVELGVWKGATSRWLACAVEENGGGGLTLVDINAEYLHEARRRVEALGLRHVTLLCVQQPTMEFLPTVSPQTDFVFMDDDKMEVAAKLALLQQRTKALVAAHDAETIVGPLKEYGAIILPMPAEPSAGDLGLVQL